MEKIIKLLKQKDYIISSLIISNYKKMNITEKELVFLIFILNDRLFFNPKYISESLNWSMPEVLEIIDSLTGKDLIKIDVRKDNNICEEYLNIDNFYEKLAFQLFEKKEEKQISTNLFDSFEKEFGRALSPIEFEIIKGWMENDFSEEIILEALKEAVYNGVFRLNYIDKILFEWKKKGIKNKKDVLINNKKFKEGKNVSEDVFDYDWLNE